jgi:hypothetical protein
LNNIKEGSFIRLTEPSSWYDDDGEYHNYLPGQTFELISVNSYIKVRHLVSNRMITLSSECLDAESGVNCFTPL